MIQTLLIIIVILLFLIALFLFFALRQNRIFESRIKKLEDEKNTLKPNVVAEPNSYL